MLYGVVGGRVELCLGVWGKGIECFVWGGVVFVFVCACVCG